jgi:predicted nucleotidyltransferase
MLKQSEIENLTAVFLNYPEIEGVYLFGSAATGKNHGSSDCDVGIVYNDDTITKKKVDLYTDLVKAGFENVDIVFFNDADLVLQFEIIHHNQLIYRTEEFNHGELFSITVRKYFDIQPLLQRQRKKIKERILNG